MSVGGNAISRLERGEGFPKAEGLFALAKFFDVNLHDLVYRDIEASGLSPKGSRIDEDEVARLVLKLNLQIDRLTEEIIERADPNDLDRLREYRNELIRRHPDKAAELGIEPE